MNHHAQVEHLRDFIKANKDQMLKDLEEVVSIHSGTFTPEGTTQVAKYFEKELAALGFSVSTRPSEEFGDHLVGSYDGGSGPRVFVVGHMDTVFEGENNWEFSRDENRTYGPGVIDMKSGLLTFVWALKALKHAGETGGRFSVLFNSDEEPGSPESRNFIHEYAQGNDFALVMEPAEPTGEILEGRKGVGIFHFDIAGVAAHAGQEPEKGASAITAAANLVLKLNEVADSTLGTTVNAGLISGGTAIYAIPPNCRISVDVRVPTTEEATRVEAQFARLQEEFNAGRISVELEGSFHRPPMAPNDVVGELISRYVEAANTLGYEIKEATSGAASDGNTLAGLGLPVLDGLGPVGGRAHSSEEYMETETYFERTETLAAFLLASIQTEN